MTFKAFWNDERYVLGVKYKIKWLAALAAALVGVSATLLGAMA